MPNAGKSSFASRSGAMNLKPLDWWLSLIVVTALAGQTSLTLATPKQPVMAPVIRQTSSIDCGLAALAMLLRDKASITTSVAALDNMAAVLSAADLVVSRAGAGAIAEITRCEVPSILVPYPFAADNHQFFNAKIHESLGGGILLDENNLEKLYEEVKVLISNHSLLEQISFNLMNLNAVNASEEIVDDLQSIIRE